MPDSPRRYQRSRKKGHHVPDGVKYVGHPTKWANPYTKDDLKPEYGDGWREQAGRLFHQMIVDRKDGKPSKKGQAYPSDDEIVAELSGKDLSCWCPIPDKPQIDWCHAAALLSIANNFNDKTLEPGTNDL